MQQYADSFVSLMSNLVTVYQKLANLAREKTDILVLGDVQKLEALLAREAELLLSAGKLEKERGILIKEWSATAGWTIEEVTTQFIMGQLETSAKERLEEKTQALKQLLDELQELNKTNGELIERALQFVNYSLELISGHDAGGMTYGANGHLGDRQGYKILDQKI